jgi:hypothetical protein
VMVAPKGVERDAAVKGDADFVSTNTVATDVAADITGLRPVSAVFRGLPFYVELSALGVQHNAAAGRVGVAISKDDNVTFVRNEFVPCAVANTDYPLATLVARLDASDGLVVGQTFTYKAKCWAQTAGQVKFRVTAFSRALLTIREG